METVLPLIFAQLVCFLVLSAQVLYVNEDFMIIIRLTPKKTVTLQGKIYVRMRSVLKYMYLMVGLWIVLPSFLASIGCGDAIVNAQDVDGLQTEKRTKGVQEVEDTLQLSLLTCAPGAEVYELYGHSALRVQHLNNGADWVFNYGIFDFSAPHFMWRFVLGQTDYTVAGVPYLYFCDAYRREGRAVTEQVLNLTPAEEARLLDVVTQHASTEGWSYRYNFLYDNCVTRLIYMIEDCVDGQVEWPVAEEGKRSFRDMLHESTEVQSPWNCFGQDLILGAEVDVPLTIHQQMFSPIYAERYVCEAVVREVDGQTRPLVNKPAPLVMSCAATPVTHGGGLTPMVVLSVFAVLWLMIGLWEMKRGKVIMALDNVILAVRGVLGILVAILFFASEHPAVGSNWLILFFNPLPLLLLVWKMIGNCREKHLRYLRLMLIESMLVGAILLVSPQVVPMMVYVLLATFALRGAMTYQVLCKTYIKVDK